MSISTFMGIETALRGIIAQQRGLDVTSHNIANANTTGYTRQRAEFVPTDAYTYPAVSRPPNGGQIGTGVDVTEYVRIRDDFIDLQLRTQLSRRGYSETVYDGLGQVELALREPSDNGLQTLLDRYWNSWQDLSTNPESMAARQAVAEAGASLANGLRTLTGQISTIVTQTAQDVTLTLDEINDIGVNLAQLNTAIYERLVVGDTPNDLFDRRDILIDRLSELGAVAVSDTDGDGSFLVQIDGVTLVDEGAAYTLTESGGNIVNATLSQTSALAGRPGKLAGLVELRDVILPAYDATLDTIAAALITNTNALQAAGFDLTGTLGSANASGGQLFTGVDASTIGFNAAVLSNPALIAASANGQPGNAATALAQANLRTAATIGLSSIDTAYAQLVTSIGSDAREARMSFDNASTVADSLENRRQAVSGVSLDEEMVGLVKYQRAYQASARALSAMDEMIELLITRTGRVGV
jgi:flagellar hook-associated protein 1 FlgK